jgi:hypothetical protein
MSARQSRIQEATKGVVAQLVTGDYQGLVRRTGGVRLSAEQMRDAVAQYGRRLRMPPDDAFKHLNVVGITVPGPRAWSVVCHLWTEEEGQSDLSLELTLIEGDRGLAVEIDDIHVL